MCEAEVPGLDAARFKEQAEQAKKNCPVSKLLTAAETTPTPNSSAAEVVTPPALSSFVPP